MSNSKVTTSIFLIVLISYLSIVFISESMYRDPLFKKSLIFQKQWQQRQTDSFWNFFQLISDSGDILLVPLLLIVFLFVPLNKSYALTSSIAYASYFSNFLKIIYASPRPYYIDVTLFKECYGGFGNPSSHVFKATTFYLSLWHISTDYKFFTKHTWGKIVKYILFIFTANFILLTILSRVFLGAHSVNQVMFGCFLGIGVYFSIFFVAGFQNLTAEEFFELFRKKVYITIFSIWFAVLLAGSILLWRFKINDTKEYEKVLNEFCPDMPDISRFNNDALSGMLRIFGIIGAHCGLIFLINIADKKYFDKNEEINHWYKSPNTMSHVYRILLVLVFMVPVVLFLTVSFNEAPVLDYVFKFSVPLFLISFGMFGLAVYYSIEANIGNNNIYNHGLDGMEQFNILEITSDA